MSRFLLALCLFLGLCLPAQAQGNDPGASAWVEKSHSRMRLISAVSAAGKAEEIALGLQVELAPHWKIYWRSPGDAGYPPSFDWTGSLNLAGATPRWPVPTRFSVLGIETVGYEHQVILPLMARLERPGDPLILRLAVDYLICAEVCVPDRGDFTLIVPPGPSGASPQAQALARFLAQVPGPSPSHGITVDEAVIETGGVVRVAVRADPPLAAPDLFVEAPAGMAFARPQVTVEEGGGRAVLRAGVVGGDALIGQSLPVLVADGVRGVEAGVDTRRALAPPAGAGDPRPTALGGESGGETGAPGAPTGPLAFLAMVSVALLGGLILNLMPCVLPVLSLKILGLVGHGGGAPRAARLSFLATSAGIIASFLVLALAAIGLKTAGMAVGWGIQFQQPLFLSGMVVLLALFAANLWGLFEIGLPGAVSGLGGQGRAGSSLSGAFATGAFATVLATPCSAPFLGTAVGFALARGPFEILAIFLALGLGMALPYLLVALRPQIATRLPRPGRWMLRLKAVLGAVLCLTALWLLSVLAVQIGAVWAAVIGGLLAVALGVRALRPISRLSGGVAALLGIAALALPALPLPALSLPMAAPSQALEETAWGRWSPEAVARLVAEGKTVLVDVTAQWCVTCKVNKATVLDAAPTRALLDSGRLSGLRADWTRPDPAIAAYLASFGRFGIPFNAVYGPGAPQGIALPELLSENALLEAVARAAGPSS
ncbi:protein-disulfide reductase DsbD family protein [Rhodospirillum rubrum]|uniref:Suppressor for copper-sensitivity B n=3 Tax=Rhodospirillum rubrum TaxID=1085 RepID=Q2RPU2_RHORT|nr:protein-disulfide reductase DsbD domain-containing protein [Rhodospirillum rubrum]ABC23853.1 putative suppressor for copper-sensitivity B precursor [Rhodospirillum rubrum ATCC 11170]AEO49595.1 putative suppressor for copper-sensitivity B [Rhodospirillum rubrum F11]MBK5955530.1 copper-binding protein [Rhodospirillum rubrum]QXG79800.1 thioredoxin family protein [Rhodospirillum rubrum]HAQ00031.1 copper-binding protein [Rhodospirillum rubrum]